MQVMRRWSAQTDAMFKDVKKKVSWDVIHVSSMIHTTLI